MNYLPAPSPHATSLPVLAASSILFFSSSSLALAASDSACVLNLPCSLVSSRSEYRSSRRDLCGRRRRVVFTSSSQTSVRWG